MIQTVDVKVGLPMASQQTEQESAFPVVILDQPTKFVGKEEDISELLD